MAWWICRYTETSEADALLSGHVYQPNLDAEQSSVVGARHGVEGSRGGDRLKASDAPPKSG